MSLENISIENIHIEKINQKLSVLQRSIAQLHELEKLEKDVERIKGVVTKFVELQRVNKTPLATEQSKRREQFISDYPYLSLYKGEAGIEVYCSAYMDDKSLKMYASAEEKELRRRNWALKIFKLISEFI